MTLTRKEWLRRYAKDEVFGRRCETATSPGPVAKRLGVTRTHVRRLLEEGKLDGVRILKPDGKTTAAILIFKDTVDAYESRRAA